MNLERQSHALWLVAIVLAVLAGLLAPAAEASGRRLSVQLDEPFQIGENMFTRGHVSLREVRALNPVTRLTEVRVNGRSLGVMLARDLPSQPSSHTDLLIFERSERGHLVLASVAVKGEPVRRLLTFDQDEPAGPALVASVK